MERESGYYWVEFFGFKCIAFYDNESKEWELNECTMGDDEFDKIYEERIKEPQ